MLLATDVLVMLTSSPRQRGASQICSLIWNILTMIMEELSRSGKVIISDS